MTRRAIFAPLRIFYFEDNPLIDFRAEAMTDASGHRFAGYLSSFAQVKSRIDETVTDGALIDIDLTDGTTGPDAAERPLKRGIASIFVTAAEQVAARYPAVPLGTIAEPIATADFAAKPELVNAAARHRR